METFYLLEASSIFPCTVTCELCVCGGGGGGDGGESLAVQALRPSLVCAPHLFRGMLSTGRTRINTMSIKGCPGGEVTR